ncbi:hypothetical protein HK097_005060, partial [Rhizophlyctis rosea]
MSVFDTDTLLPVENGTSIEDDAPLVKDTRYYNFILVAPFIAIPLSIILYRLGRYLWRIYQAKVYGFDDDVFSDPLAELGLSLSRGYRNTTDIRKIRKEQRRLQIKEARRLRARQSLHHTYPPSSASQIPSHQPPKPSTTRRFNFAPLHLAETYFHTLRRKTRRTWSARLSPQAIRTWFATSRTARLWMVFQVLCTLLSIINYVLLTYTIQRTDRKAIKHLDLFLATMFLIDYSLSLYTAEDRLRAYFHPSALVDLVSIVPPFIYVLISETSQYVWFLGLLRILRASRILRTYRLLSFSETEEKRELTILALGFMNFVFLSASIINALESINAGRKDSPTLERWHDSLYYIMVTFSTIGFGDLTPSSIPSRIVVMLLIVIVIVFVPLQTGRLAEIYNSTSAYHRARYSASSDHAHVVVAGDITVESVVEFCREWFEEGERGGAEGGKGVVVLLCEREPGMEMRRLLRNPQWRGRIVYLCGTSLSIPDLRRSSAQYATALFLLNTSSTPSTTTSEEEEQLRVTRGQDAQTLMYALVAKTAFKGLPIFAQVQDIRSQDLSNPCGVDRILCVDEVKMSIVARGVLVPGVLSLIVNLVCCYRDDFAGHYEGGWTEEYRHGSMCQLGTLLAPPGFVGMRFTDVVKEVFVTFGATVVGVVRLNSGFDTNGVRLNPGWGYRVRREDVLVVCVDGGDEAVLRIGL